MEHSAGHMGMLSKYQLSLLLSGVVFALFIISYMKQDQRTTTLVEGFPYVLIRVQRLDIHVA